MENNNGIVTAIEQAQEKYISEKIFRGRWKSIRASGLDDVCNRRLYYYLTQGELAKPFNNETIALMEEGKDQEPGVRRFLSEMGFEVKRASANAEWPEYMISGQTDGTLEKYLVEIKTVGETAWRTLNTIEDFLETDWYRKWYGQLQIYLLLFNYEKGLFILKRKQAKQLRIIEIPLNYEYAEKLLQKAEIVKKAYQDANPPEYLKSNPVECKKCPFYEIVCSPPLDFGEMAIIEDIELEKKLIRRDELTELKSEYDALDKEVKERFKEIPAAICGNFSISGKAGIMKLKAQEAREIPTWKVKIEKITE